MIQKRLKKLLKIGGLIAIRQGYLLGRNLYNLYYQPYLTIKEIVEKQDKSQIFLIVLSAMTPSILYIVARVIFDLVWYQRLVMVTGRVFLIAGGIQLVVLVYLGYWTFKVLKNK